MQNINIDDIEDIRIGRHISMTLDVSSEEAAACKKILVNDIIETYTFQLNTVE